MQLIKLTYTANGDHVYINADLIIRISPKDSGSSVTILEMYDNECCYFAVEESPEQIIDLIEKGRSTTDMEALAEAFKRGFVASEVDQQKRAAGLV